MTFECKSLAHYKICEWLAEMDEQPAAIEIVDLGALKITGSLGQTMVVRWDAATDVMGIE